MTLVDNDVLEDLRRSEQQHRLLLDTLPHGVQRNSCDGTITYSNPAHHAILGREQGELIGKKIWDLLANDEDKRNLRLYLETLVNDQPPAEPYVAQNMRKDGSTVDLQIDWTYEYDDDGKLKGFISVITDISARTAAERQIRRHNMGLSTLLTVSQSLVQTLDTDAILQIAVDGVTELSGLDTAAVYLVEGKHLGLAATTPPLPGSFPDHLRRATLADHPHAHEAVTSRAPVLLPDMQAESLTPQEREIAEQRRLRTVLFIPLIADTETLGLFIVGSRHEPKPISGSSLDLARALANLSALTLRNASLYRDGRMHAEELERSLIERVHEEAERKVLQEQLNQAQKLESVGRLAGGVAHDFNNMLAVILGHASLAMEILPADHPLGSHLSQIHSAAERSSDLTRQLLAFARKQTIDPQLLDLNEVVGDMLKMLHRLIGEDIHLAWIPGAELGLARLDPAQVDQIMANLCVNARDAISGVGKVTIETANVAFDEQYCSEHPGFKVGRYVMIAVSDDGAGMDRDVQRMIFEPFFTTKEEGKGTGLGLSTVYGIVKQNKGFLNVYSEPGQGTTIKIYLPRYSDAVDLDEALESGTSETLGGDETILLVEDEETVLELAREMLESLGYRVLAAGGPKEAMQIADNHDAVIDALVTDVVMPEMNGRDLSRLLVQARPALKTLFVSGYTANVIAHQGILEDGVVLLSKPFSKQDLGLNLRMVLDARRES